MHNAARTGNLERLKEILSARTVKIKQLKATLEDEIIVNKQDEYGRTIIHYAALNNHLEMVKESLSKEVIVPLKQGEAAILSNSTPEDPLYDIYPGIYGVVRKFKIDIHIQDIYGYTPLDLAVLNEHTEVVKNIVIFMNKEIKNLFVTPEDAADYEFNEDKFLSITLDYQQKIIQSFINTCQKAQDLPNTSSIFKKFLKEAIMHFETQQKQIEANAKDPRFASRMNQGVIPVREVIFCK